MATRQGERLCAHATPPTAIGGAVNMRVGCARPPVVIATAQPTRKPGGVVAAPKRFLGWFLKSTRILKITKKNKYLALGERRAGRAPENGTGAFGS